ncbi:helix-turn-helix domain-containing protein [Streptomyces evansiae]|uniref:helix-turn-helix domain-containing protein n=1 Tax=Streptomyces evansiae TaxID=3075535 RepID=UPI002884EAE4|nr:helix-turn-helix transcriptional regulator [Streptomyces sp. DSM 41859]MDT0423731.1 helix-turn-helix transcriptional regulator [Streptomyces sp. DSM 41859]
MVNRRKLDPDESPRAAFGARLRGLREARGWTQPELGVRMGYAASHISGVETGSRGATAAFSRRADEVFGTGDALTRQGDEVRHPATLQGFDEYVALEKEVLEIRVLELTAVPGLVQTRRYAAALQAGAMARGAVTAQQVTERLGLLTARQSRLTGANPPKVYMVIDEAALYRRVGGTDVMAEQCGRLLDFAALPHAVLQVSPFSLGEHRALGFPLYLLTLRNGARVAYTESAQRGHLERESRYVEALVTAYQHLQVECPPQAESAQLIERIRRDRWR